MEKRKLDKHVTDKWDAVLEETQEESRLKQRGREPEIPGSKCEERQNETKCRRWWEGCLLRDGYESGPCLRFEHADW